MTFSQSYINYLEEANPELGKQLSAGFSKKESPREQYEKKAALFSDFIKEAFKQNVFREASKDESYDFLSKDIYIKDEMSKFAGMVVYDSTPEGIEAFLKEYMYNELSFFPDKINISVNILPLDNTPVNNGTGQLDPNISNATGTIDLFYINTLIQIPFAMRDKEILPFDTIQLGSENAVYTRENLKNILFNIKNMIDKQQAGNGLSASTESYVGVDKTVNNLTDTGFMGDMLQIQSLMGNVGNGGSVYSYASKVNDLLEKTAKIEKVNIDYRKLRDELIKEYKESAEKIASAEFEENEALELEKKAIFDNLEREISADIQILNNKDKFEFTEKDGMIVSKTQGIVYKTILSIDNVTIDENLVITSDGRFKLLKPGEKFIFNYKANKDEIAPFEFKLRKFDSLNPGYIYTAEIGGTCLLPFIVTKVTLGSQWKINTPFFYKCQDIKGNEFIIIPASNVPEDAMVKKSKKDIMGIVAATEKPKNLAYYNVVLKASLPVLCLSPKTKFISLKQGVIGNMISAKDTMLLYDGNVKMAAYRDEVKITLVSRDSGDPKFNLVASWFDKKYNSNRRLVLDNISESRLKGVLKTMGFDYNKVSEIAFRASKEGTAVYELVPGTTPWLVKPEVTVERATDNTIKNMKDSFFTITNAKKALAPLLGGIAGGMIADTALGDSLSGLKAFASEGALESKALAEKLEKVAIVKKSGSFNKLAGLMVIKNRVDNLVSDVLSGEEFKNTEVLAELHEIDPYMQKLAYDLVKLKLDQAFHRNEVLSPNVINATLRHLDGLHKYANCFKEASIAPNLDFQDKVIKAVDSGIKAETVEAPLEPKPGKPLVGGMTKAVLETATNTVSTPTGMAGVLAVPFVAKKVMGRKRG